MVLHVIAFRNLSHCLYAVASLYLISLIMDRVVYGGKQSKVACIISDRHEELTAALLEMHRGITLLDGEGGFTHQAHKVILCAFAKNQILMHSSSCTTPTRCWARASAPINPAVCNSILFL